MQALIMRMWVLLLHYDEHHRRFHDYKKSAEDIISVIGLRSEHTVIDMGCGTGAFVLPAATRCKKVYAVDVSAVMLERLKEKAEKDNVRNIEYHQAGFLTYEHKDEPVDAVVSVAALHHLPDFWKLVGLSRVADMLKPGGSLCLFDVVYSFNAREYKDAFDQWVSSTEASLGKEFADETVIHIRDEYSTCDWILEGMLERSGFAIKEKRILNTIPGTTYLCMRNGL